MAQQIIIKQAYFDNIKITIDAINKFFSSQFQVKEFPSIESETDVDPTIGHIVDLLNDVEPSWIDNQDKVDACLASINETLENEENLESLESSSISDRINAYIGYKALLFISDNFDSFSELMNAIYTFDLYMDPDKYHTIIEKMSQPIDISDLAYEGEEEFKIFSLDEYVEGIFSNVEYIDMGSLDKDEEFDRIKDYHKQENAEVVVDTSEADYEDEEYEEESFHMEAAAEKKSEAVINNIKPIHIKYDEKGNKFVLSKQLKDAIKGFIDSLEACESTEDLKNIFTTSKLPQRRIDLIMDGGSPFVINKVLLNPKKSQLKADSIKLLKDYEKAYNKTKDKNQGGTRFFNYDLFSTFKVDKEGTIQFLKDFLTCELFNNKNAKISNNTLLTIFNIFDSRIYFDRLYSLIPEKIKQSKYPTEDGFVKKIRAQINKTSRSAKVYDTDKKDDNASVKTPEQVQEYVYKTLKAYKDFDANDITNINVLQEMAHQELSIIGNLMYNNKISQVAVGRVFQEMEMGDIPDYMKERLNISDKDADDITVSQAQVPDNTAPVPDNSFDDLANSIDEKINSFDSGSVDDMLGTGYEDRFEDGAASGKGVVYNITNNYNYSNSFNKNSGNTQNDSSSGKTVNITNTNSNNDSSTTEVGNRSNDSDPVPIPKNLQKQIDDELENIEEPTNNSNNNSNKEEDTMTSPSENNSAADDIPDFSGEDFGFDDGEHDDRIEDKIDHENSLELDTEDSDNENKDTFSNGMSVNEFFTALMEVAEPLSDSMGTVNNNQQVEMPEEETSTHILDVDRKKRKKIDKAKNAVNASVQPIKRVKLTIKKALDSLSKRDINEVKGEILENGGYRHWLQKVARFCIKTGAIAIAWTINMYIGAAVTALMVSREVHKKDKVTKEVQAEFATEIAILDDKIELAERRGDNKAKWQMMRLKSKMEHMMTQDATKTGHIKTSKQVF